MSKLKSISLYTLKIRGILNLKGTIFEDIPNELVLIPFINRKASTRLSKETLEWLQKTVGSTNYEEYEFMGDAIINLIARVSIFDPETYSNGLMSRFYTSLSRNKAFTCMMMYNKPGLIAIADELAGYHVSDDDIADMLEALIAALYDYLSQQMGYRAIEYVHQYLRDEFLWDLYVTRVLNNQNDPICGISPIFKLTTLNQQVSNISDWSTECDALNRILRTINYNNGTSVIEYKNCPQILSDIGLRRLNLIDIVNKLNIDLNLRNRLIIRINLTSSLEDVNEIDKYLATAFPQVISYSEWSAECDELNRRHRTISIVGDDSITEYKPCAVEGFLTLKELNVLTTDQLKTAIIDKINQLTTAEEIKRDLMLRTLESTSRTKLKQIYIDIFKISLV